MTPAKQRIAAYRARQKAKGMREIAVHLTPEALEALHLLLDTSPDTSMGEVISSALVTTAAKLKPKVPAPAPTSLAVPIMLSTTETARRLAVTVPDLVHWRKESRGPKARRVKDTWRYSEQDVTDWIKEGIRIAEEFAQASEENAQ